MTDEPFTGFFQDKYNIKSKNYYSNWTLLFGSRENLKKDFIKFRKTFKKFLGLLINY